MAEQQQFASLSKLFGRRLSAANEAVKDKPPEIGRKQLPAGIRNGVAKLSSVYTKVQEEEGKQVPKGMPFFRCSAIVVTPEEYAGAITQQIVPLCDIPEQQGDGYTKKAVSFEENYNTFRSIMQSLGIDPCPHTVATDPDGTKADAYWQAAMQALSNPAHPVYITFSTRGFTPKATKQKPNPTEMVFEDWHGKLAADKAPPPPNPKAGVGAPPASTQPPPNTPPPSANGAQAAPPTFRQDVAAAAPEVSLADRVAALVEVAMGDPAGETDDGADAQDELEKLALAAGWTEATVTDAADWAAVGEMALSAPGVTPEMAGVPSVGDKFLFAKRDAKGERLKNSKTKAELPPQEVEVTSVDADAGTCTVKTKDGKDVLDLRSKKPVAVKFEWLEPLAEGAPPY